MKTYQVLWRLVKSNSLFGQFNPSTFGPIIDELTLLAFKKAAIPAKDRFKELVEYTPSGPRTSTTNLVLPDGPPALDPKVLQFPVADHCKREGESMAWEAPPAIPVVPELFGSMTEATRCDCKLPCGCSPCVQDMAKSVAEELFGDDEAIIKEAELESVIETLKTPAPKKKRINKRVTKKPKK